MFNRLNQLFLRSEFMRNVLTLMSGTTIAQAVPFLVAPVISRLYTPEQMDVLTLYLGMVNFLAPAVTGTYEHALMLPETDEDAVHVGALAGMLSISACLVALIAVIFFNQEIAAALNNQSIAPWLFIVPLGILLLSLYSTFNFWAIRRKRYRRAAASRVAQSVTTAAVQVGGFSLGAGGLVLGALLGQGMATGTLTVPAWIKDRLGTFRLGREKLRRQARRYADFPKYTMPQTFLDGVNESGLVFLISALFVRGTLGSYGFALKVLKAPLNLIGLAIGQVFYQKAADTYNSGGDLWHLLKEVLLRLVLIGLPVLVILLFFGPPLFAFVFGEEWRAAGRFAQILSPWLVTRLVSSPISQLPFILRKQKPYLFVGAGFNLAVPLSFGIAALTTRDIECSLIVVSATATIYLLGIISWFIWLTKKEGRKDPQETG